MQLRVYIGKASLKKYPCPGMTGKPQKHFGELPLRSAESASQRKLLLPSDVY
jgi:hypothetical protein